MLMANSKNNSNTKIIALIVGLVVALGIITAIAVFAVPAFLNKEDPIPYTGNGNGFEAAKPVIFLYTDKDLDFTINTKFNINNSFIYPAFNSNGAGWRGKALAGKESKLLIDGKSYDYLFWEGETGAQMDLSKGNIVARQDSVAFMEKALTAYGLNDREKEDFITFWGPKLNKNEYNQISFVNDQYARLHPMDVSPKPDYEQRVFMVFKKANKDTLIEKQEFNNAPVRHGFSLIEWGGAEL